MNVVSRKSPFLLSYLLKKKTIIILFSIIFSFIPTMIWSQEINKDSLIQQAHILDSLSEYHFDIGNDSIAIAYSEQSLSIHRHVNGEDHPDYAKALSQLAYYYDEVGYYQVALDSVSKAIDIQKRRLGTNHSDYAESLIVLANINMNIGNILNAIRLGENSLVIIRNIYGNNSIEYAFALASLGSYYYVFGNAIKSLKLNEEAEQIFIKTDSINGSEYATILVNISKCHSELGNIYEAIRIGLKATLIFRELYGINHPSYATAISCLSVYYFKIGKFDEALRIDLEALNVYKRTYGEYNPNIATQMWNIAEDYYALDDINASILYTKKAQKIQELNFGKNHAGYASSLYRLAKYFLAINDYDNAECASKESLGIYKELSGTSSISYAESLLLLIQSKIGMKKYKEALLCLKEIENIDFDSFRNEIGNHRYASILDEISHYYSDLGIYEKAFPFARKSIDIFKGIIIRNFPYMSMDNRRCIFNLAKNFFTYYPGLAIRFNYKDFGAELYNIALFTKCLLLYSEIDMRTRVAESSDSTLQNQYDQLENNYLVYKTQSFLPIEERSLNLDSLNQVLFNQEKDFTTLLNKENIFMPNYNLLFGDIQQNLQSDEIAIEYLSIPIKNDSIIYAALTLRKDSKVPKLTVLFEEKQLKEVSDTLFYHCKEMSDLVWKPLLPELQGIKNVYFAPSGALYNIGIEYLPGMEDYNIYRLSSTRELATGGETRTGKRAVLYGGLDYYAQLDTLSRSQGLTALSETFVEHANVRGLNVRGGKERLKHTQEEVELIGKELNKADWTCLLDTASIGTEESFKSLSGKQINTLHIATHGFYYTQEEADNKGYQFMLLDENRTSAEDKALTRSGLLMAGANHVLAGDTIPDNVEDGILTAKEIADIDLRGLDMVVLSACQTGLGDIAQSEGVFGLQRGFKKAGAKSILMSLWEVDDKATQILMTQFYKSLVSGQSKHQALKSAQKYLREAEGGKYDEPKYWAAFVLLDGKNEL